MGCQQWRKLRRRCPQDVWVSPPFPLVYPSHRTDVVTRSGPGQFASSYGGGGGGGGSYGGVRSSHSRSSDLSLTTARSLLGTRNRIAPQ
jgi:hypothetical protein